MSSMDLMSTILGFMAGTIGPGLIIFWLTNRAYRIELAERLGAAETGHRTSLAERDSIITEKQNQIANLQARIESLHADKNSLIREQKEIIEKQPEDFSVKAVVTMIKKDGFFSNESILRIDEQLYWKSVPVGGKVTTEILVDKKFKQESIAMLESKVKNALQLAAGGALPVNLSLPSKKE